MRNCEERDTMKTLLVSLLYDEIEPEERAALERHLEGCAACREELAALGRVRQVLAEREPAVPELPPRTVTVLPARVPRAPLWAAAASLLLAGALAVFALGDATVRTGPEGFTLSFAEVSEPSPEPLDPGELRALVMAEARQEAQRTVRAALDERESRDNSGFEQALLRTIEDRQDRWERGQQADLNRVGTLSEAAHRDAEWTRSVVEYALLSNESPRLVEQ